MSTRRTILRGIIGSLAASAYALAGGPTTSTAAAAQQGDRQWFEESLSGTRDATQEERDSILPDLHNRVIEAGHPSETVDVAATGVTASVSSRGTTVLKAALMMSEELFFILVKETSESSAPRTALVVQLLCSRTLYRVLRPVRGLVVKPIDRSSGCIRMLKTGGGGAGRTGDRAEPART